MNEQEKQAALAWAEDVCSNACSKTSALGYGKTLAASLRAAESELAVWNEWAEAPNVWKAKFENAASRLKTLEEENARMRGNIETMNARIALDAKSYERDQYLIGQLRKQLATKTATLKQEAE